MSTDKPYGFYPWMGKYPRQCVAWSRDEEAEAVKLFNQGVKLEEIAQRHGRQTGAIESRLFKLLGTNYYYAELNQKEKMMAEIKEVPHKELQAQWHEDYARHLRTGEPMSVWQFFDPYDEVWGPIGQTEPKWREDRKYRKQPKTVKVWDWFIEYKDGSVVKWTGKLSDCPNFFQINLAQKIDGTEREVEV